MKFEHILSPHPEQKPQSPASKSAEDGFSYTADDIINELQSKKIEHIGTGTSDYQAHPGLLDEQGQPMSDWELTTQDGIEQNCNKIHTPNQVSDLPRYFDKTKDYVKMGQKLGMNMSRISFDFARLCPDEGQFDKKMMSKYIKALALMKAHGQEPLVAMHHWTMPKYLLTFDKNNKIKSGGWENPEAARHFRFYVEKVVEFLGSEDNVRTALDEQGFDKRDQDKFIAEGLVKHFLTINEPSTLLLNSYMAGIFPPYKIGALNKLKEITGKLVEIHDMTRSELKSSKLEFGGDSPQVGLAHNWQYFDGALGNVLQGLNEKMTRKFERAGDKSDFLALQYYCRVTFPSFYQPIPPFKIKGKGRDYGDHSGFGDIYPPGIYEHLKRMNEMYPNKEIYITEFGFSDARDKKRPYWILETMRYVLEAMRAGVPIKGMLLWSLVNNFEWERGMEQKFGLFDEKDLSKPLQASSGDNIRSWEAWQTVGLAITQPTLDNIQNLQIAYEKAKRLYAQADY